MSDQENKMVPSSPEVQSPEVRQELDQNSVSHEGYKGKGPRVGNESQSYMGTTEGDVTPVINPMAGPMDVTSDGPDEDSVNPHTELTPG